MQPTSQCQEAPCQRIRVLVVDNHAAVRHALEAFVLSEGDMALAGATASGREAVRLCAVTRPDVVLMDVSLADADAAVATRAIRETWPCIQVIAMSSFQEEERIPEILKAGATGHLLKNVSAEELAWTIRHVHSA